MTAVLTKELRSLLRETRGWLVPWLYTVLVYALAITALLLEESTRTDLGRSFAFATAIVQIFVVLVVAPLTGAASIAAEREQGTWTRLLSSPTSRLDLAVGKAGSTAIYTIMLLSITAPFAGLAIGLGAADLSAIAGLYLTHGVSAMSLGCVGVAISSLFGRTWTAGLAALGLTLCLCIIPLLLGLEWLYPINPCYGSYLFFTDPDASGAPSFLAHYAAMGLVGALAVSFLVLRLRSARS